MTRSKLLKLLTNFICSITRDHPLRVAVDGIDAAGKTTLAAELASEIRAVGRPLITASIDGFHNPRAIRYRRGADSPEGYFLDSFDYTAVKEQLLEPLGPGGNRRCRTAVFDHRVDKPLLLPQAIAPENAILLIDGIFLFREQLIDHWDLKIFVDISFETSLKRGAPRDSISKEAQGAMQDRYLRRYIPGQKLYFQIADPKSKADLIIGNEDPNNPTLRIINPNLLQ